MQEQAIKETLNDVVGHVLEQTAFMFPEPMDMQDGISFDEFDFILARLTFDGEKKGVIMFIVPKEFCIELAGNMLGEELNPDEPDGKDMDALKEILNIIAGRFLTEMFGEKAIFNLATPEVMEISRENFFSLITENEYACSMSDEYPLITIFSDKKEQYEHSGAGS